MILKCAVSREKSRIVMQKVYQVILFSWVSCHFRNSKKHPELPFTFLITTFSLLVAFSPQKVEKVYFAQNIQSKHKTENKLINEKPS